MTLSTIEPPPDGRPPAGERDGDVV